MVDDIKEKTLEEALNLSEIVGWCSGNVRIALHQEGKNARYYVTITFDDEVSVSSASSFNDAHTAYIAGCLAASSTLRKAVL